MLIADYQNNECVYPLRKIELSSECTYILSVAKGALTDAEYTLLLEWMKGATDVHLARYIGISPKYIPRRINRILRKVRVALNNS